ncbi:unnamed protein product [Owenia fusiformis]|uniref:Uncharacterized protein n=1 Tax=Owenia fusiformis TaxID=6347 RepID=A0A8J1Y370_OWEFU|nr:unnamed protein product [Owenia fusiformis]
MRTRVERVITMWSKTVLPIVTFIQISLLVRPSKGLDCHSANCANLVGEGDCTSTIQTCGPGQDACRGYYYYNGGVLTISKSCDALSGCQSGQSTDNCDNEGIGPYTTRQCTYCCTGNLCNEDPESGNQCRTGEFLKNGKCVQFVNLPQRWADAETKCQGNGGHLAIPETQSDIDFYQTLITDSTVTLEAWIGVKYISPDTQDLNGATMTISNYIAGEPDNSGQCVYSSVSPSVGWLDGDCLGYKAYICARNGLSGGSASTDGQGKYIHKVQQGQNFVSGSAINTSTAESATECAIVCVKLSCTHFTYSHVERGCWIVVSGPSPALEPAESWDLFLVQT